MEVTSGSGVVTTIESTDVVYLREAGDGKVEYVKIQTGSRHNIPGLNQSVSSRGHAGSVTSGIHSESHAGRQLDEDGAKGGMVKSLRLRFEGEGTQQQGGATEGGGASGSSGPTGGKPPLGARRGFLKK